MTIHRARVFVVVSALVVVCAASAGYLLRERTGFRRMVAGSEAFRLSSSELRTLEWRAELGDAESAYRVSQYFTFWIDDPKLGRIWLERAARRGHRDATFNLGARLLDSRSGEERARGRKLLMQLAAQGDADARAALEAINAESDGER